MDSRRTAAAIGERQSLVAKLFGGDERSAVVAFILILLGVLVAGFWSLDLIPFYRPFLGLDFQNIYAYQTCPAARNLGLYVASGTECGDVSGRSFNYPPSLFHLFFWVRFFAFDDATRIWLGVSAALMAIVGGVWLWLDGRVRKGWRLPVLILVWALLMGQFPFVFALERGNNDIIPVALWTLAAAMYVRSFYSAMGVASGLAVALKLYPIVAFAVLIPGLLRMKRRIILAIGLGGLVGGLLAVVLWPSDTVQYLTVNLPTYAGRAASPFLYSHPLKALPFPSVMTAGLALLLFGSWGIAAWRRLSESPTLVFAGALAISTYFSSVSYDYNLITVFPLLLMVVARAMESDASHAWKVASIGSVLAIAAGRDIFTPTGQILMQVLALVGIAWLVLIVGDPRGSADQPRAVSNDDAAHVSRTSKAS